MENFISGVESVNGALNSFAWGPLMLLLLVGTGVYLTIRVHWLQVTHFGRILKNTVGTLFRKQEAKDHGANISPFQAVSTALAGSASAMKPPANRRAVVVVNIFVCIFASFLACERSLARPPSGTAARRR